MVRMQVRLTEEQHAAVKQMGVAESVSMAEVIRRSVDDFIRRRHAVKTEDRWERARAAAGFIEGGPSDLAESHDDYLAEAFEA